MSSEPSSRRLEGRTAIVTGGAHGLGRAYSERFAAEGARVVVADIDGAGAGELVSLLEESGAQALSLTVDVTDEGSVAVMASETTARYGGVDVLVNNAGIYPANTIDEMSLAEWRRIFSINVEGTFLPIQSVLPAMRKGGRGRIINISSSTVWVGTPGMSCYVASKAAVIGLTRSLARDLAPDSITVNAVSPGLVLTETAAADLAEAVPIAIDQQAIKRSAMPEDIVGAVAFLASDDAAFVTGQTINVDGGQAMH